MTRLRPDDALAIGEIDAGEARVNIIIITVRSSV
jgi:hypothetical protein